MNAAELYAMILVALDPQGCDTTDADTLRAVVELHRPVEFMPYSDLWLCKGCDPGDYAEGEPSAPCSTLELIAEALGIEVPK